MATTGYIDPVIYWPASPALGVSDFELTVPVDTKGRIEIWKVPVNEAYPEGYFVSVNTGSSFTTVEPGCNSWEKTLLVTVSMGGVPIEGSEMGSMAVNRLEYCHPEIAFNDSKLNPNTFTKPGEPVPTPEA